MLLSAVRQAVRDYLDDPTGKIWTVTDNGELNKAINEAQLSLVQIAEQVDTSALHATRFLEFKGYGAAGLTSTHDEIPLPINFRRLILVLKLTDTTVTQVEIVQFSQAAHYPSGFDVMYVRERSSGIRGPQYIDEETGLIVDLTNPDLIQGLDTIGARWVLGGPGNPITGKYQIHYAAFPATLVNDADESDLPLDMHFLIALDAAVRLRKADRRAADQVAQLQMILDEGIRTVLSGVRDRSGVMALS